MALRFGFHKFVFAALILLLTSAFSLKAQGDLRFFGTATKDGKPLSGATVTVQMDGKQIINLTTGKNGKFKFTIDLGHFYRINYSAPGCVDMYMTMDLKVPAEKSWIYPDYVVEVPFFAPNDSKVKTELYGQKPFIKVIYDGSAGFHDDPSYRFIDEVFKDPNEELRKRQEEERLKREADEKARLEEEERLRKQREELERTTQNPVLTLPEDINGKDPINDPVPTNGMESEAMRLERERQEKERQERENKNVKANYENNLLKMVAESEKKSNLQKYNRMKEEAEGNSVVSALRKQAQVKGQREFLIEQDKERQRQTRVNRQTRELQLRKLVETSAQVERDINVSGMKPVVTSGPLNYEPHPHVVTVTREGIWTDEKQIVISWPGGKRTIFKTISYWWAEYFYIDEREVAQSEFENELELYRKEQI
jgi:hypothetical protein